MPELIGGDVEGLRVGMLGCGAVGTGVARLLVEHGRPVRDRAGVPIALQRVAVRDVTRKRDPAVDPTMVSGDAAAVVADPEVDVVVEVMGGIEPARSLILEAIRLGKPVVTANKELLANVGSELFAAAVLGDLVDAAANLRQGAATPMTSLPRAVIRPIDEVRSEYYVHLDVSDRPGVLAAVAGVFAEHDVSIRSVEQEGLGDEARLIFITHEAPEAAVQATLQQLRHLDVVDRVAGLLRVVGE
jgi:predicted amino acid-binding ACT domain protein